MYEIQVTSSGVLEHPEQARALVEDWLRDVEDAIADRGSVIVHDNLHATLRHPTGYYESHVLARRRDGLAEVTDSGVVYGHWLEGTGSRNRTTRFKGYLNFRRAAQKLQDEASEIAQEKLPKLVEKLS